MRKRVVTCGETPGARLSRQIFIQLARVSMTKVQRGIRN
jgi:hypothetical protein